MRAIEFDGFQGRPFHYMSYAQLQELLVERGMNLITHWPFTGMERFTIYRWFSTIAFLLKKNKESP